ncbi:MAG TPA: FtsQ-type POTRA domain-containing protein [Moorella mulderi]|nr:FtsQ-type POTRA domain-containing protein [Moorella mulderi]
MAGQIYHFPSKGACYKRRRVRVLILLLLLGACYGFIHSPFFRLEDIEFEGNRHVSCQELLGLMGVEKGINIWRIDTGLVCQRLGAHPLIEKVQVRRCWPGKLLVQVKERTPMALLYCQGKFWVLDREGVVMFSRDKLGNLSLPLITGCDPGPIGPGYRIEDEGIRAALKVIACAPQPSPIQEVIAPSPEHLNLVWAGNFFIKFGEAHASEEKFSKIYQALASLDTHRGEVEYIDVSFTGPPVVKYNQKEHSKKKE